MTTSTLAANKADAERHWESGTVIDEIFSWPPRSPETHQVSAPTWSHGRRSAHLARDGTLPEALRACDSRPVRSRPIMLAGRSTMDGVWLWARPCHRVATLVAVGSAGATWALGGASFLCWRWF